MTTTFAVSAVAADSVVLAKESGGTDTGVDALLAQAVAKVSTPTATAVITAFVRLI